MESVGKTTCPSGLAMAVSPDSTLVHVFPVAKRNVCVPPPLCLMNMPASPFVWLPLLRHH